VEAEYGEEVSRDEQDPTGNEIHRVLSGGVLGAPIVPLKPAANQCTPECKSSRSEICAEIETEMRCVCRPGFARMFPDRPCKRKITDASVYNLIDDVLCFVDILLGLTCLS